MKKALITGISGSGASYLADFLLFEGLDVHGIARWHSTSNNNNLKKIIDKVTVHECDLLDLSSVIRTLRKVKPDYIFHLASHANVKSCFDNPIAVMNNNVNCTINLFEAIRLENLDPIIQFCGTSEVYGQVKPEDLPITEENKIDPVNIYAISKLTQEKIAKSYHLAYDMKVVITRMFAYINPRRPDIFSSAFTKKIVDIERGERKMLTHGNLESTRTLIDVRDAMESYWIASNRCAYGEEYNIGGETVITVGEFLDVLKTKARAEIPSEVDPALFRPVDVTLQVPSVEKFRKQTGWYPKYSFEDSVELLLDYYRNEN
tara:strand:- start:1712 stop:2665 length:954 start_codon:yes stop_codon:yes gene_type:complete